jgi:hypothetical protein
LEALQIQQTLINRHTPYNIARVIDLIAMHLAIVLPNDEITKLKQFNLPLY